MQKYVNFIDNLPIILKIIFALPILDGIFYGIYRIFKGKLILGIVWIFFGAVLGWIIDIFSLVTKKGKIAYFI